MARRNYKKEKEDLEKKVQDLKNSHEKKVQNLQNSHEKEVQDLQNSNDLLQQDVEVLSTTFTEKENEYNNLKQDVFDKEERIESLESEIDEHNTKLMAVEFEKVAKEYKDAREKWLIISYGFFTLTSVILLYLYNSSLSVELTLAERITSGFVSFFFIGVLAWMFKQFNFYRNLNVDMTHRRNLAQTYHNILRSGEVEDEIKSALATALIKFLTSPPNTKEGKGIFNDILNDKLNK